MTSRIRRRRALLLATLALLLAALLWSLLPTRLSRLEQSIVGSWWTAYGSSRDTTFVLEFRPDRSCVQRKLDGSEMGPGLDSLAGKWKVKDGILVCDWRRGSEAVVPVRVIPAGVALGQVPLPSLHWVHAQGMGQIVGVTADELVLQWPDGTLETYKRYGEPGGK